MRIDRNTGLVLEGGGMRGVFTSGVLDGFMKHDMYFHYVVAVSAGACNGMSYMSRQIRRARISNIDYLSKYKYIG
ncbi:MAG: patatin-like phospholipase family protein, partial [Xylanibacter rarus]